MKASSECFTYEDNEPKQCRMISSVNDILMIAKELGESSETMNLIHQDDDLVEIFYELVNAGYMPSVAYECGRLTRLVAKFNKIIFIIRTQQLVTSSIDGMVCVSSEIVYNNMEAAHVNFKKQLFRKEFKSYLTDLDITLLNEYRATANVGKLQNISEAVVEIDVSKAYTSAFRRIKEVPIFNEFDNFRLYRNEPILDFNLYIIKTTEINLFCNKQYNLCYGKFLRHLRSYEIMGFKRPSFIKKVDYKSISNELWNAEISSIPTEDTHIKKLIGNVNYGMLEKGQNTRVKSRVYETIDEAKAYQSE